MAEVGRPSEVDGNGEVIEKKVININVPVKLIAFLKENNINRSKLFSESCKKLYDNEICPRCYSSDLHRKPVGIECMDCNQWIKMHNCRNCNSQYQPEYNMFVFRDGSQGCQDSLGG